MNVKRNGLKCLVMMLLTILLVVACSSNGNNEGEDNDGASPGNNSDVSQNNDDAKGNTTNSDQENEVKDYGTIRFIRPAGQEKPGNEKVSEYIKERAGMKIEPIYGANPIETFNLMLASGEEVDGLKMPLNDVLLQASKKTLLPLDEYIDKFGPNLKKRIGEELFNWVKGDDGKIYGIPSASEPHRYATQVRKDWLEALDLEVPSTIDDFTNVLEAFKENASQLRGDDTELYPLFISVENTDMALLGAFLPEGASWWKNDDGTYLPPEYHPEYTTYLQTLQDWYTAGLINPDSFLMNTSFLNEFGPRNMIGASISTASAPFFADFDKTKKEFPDMDFTVAELGGKYDLGVPKLFRPGGAFVLSAKSENPEGMIRFLNWSLENKKNLAVVRRGIPDVNYKVLDEETYTIETLPVEPEDEYAAAFALVDLPLSTKNIEILKGSPRLDLYMEYGRISPTLKSYVPLDEEILLNPQNMESMKKYATDLKTAKDEEFIRVVTGESSVDSWNDFLNTWKKIGMEEVIAEKNEIYKNQGL